MKELFLIAALALPALPWSRDKIFDELVRMFERDNPNRTIVLVNKEEKLLNGVYTGWVFREKYHVYVIKRFA